MKRGLSIIVLLVFFAGGCAFNSKDVQTRDYFSEEFIELDKRQCKGIAFDEIELDFVLNLTKEHQNDYYGIGSGLALNDLDNDGLIDIFLVNFDGDSSIFWNKGNLEFEKEIFATKSGRNVNLVDYNGDHRIDVFLTFFNESPILFENRLVDGKTIFQKTSFKFMKYALPSDWADVDKDGDLDLVLAAYERELIRVVNLTRDEVKKYGVKLFVNDDGDFNELQLSNQSDALIAMFYDINDDGYPDIFIGNDFMQLGDSIFLCNEEGCQQDTIFEITAGNTMSYSFGDIDNDGDTEAFSTDMLFYEPEIREKVLEMHRKKNFTIINNARISKSGTQIDRNVLHINTGNEFIEDAENRGISATGWSWSSKFLDVNNDGFLDLYIVNGMVENKYLKNLIGRELVEENFIFINDGKGYFNEDKDLKLNSEKGGRSMSFADLDNDGDVDIVVNNALSKASIFVNNECENDFVEFELYQNDSQNVYSIGGKVILDTSIGTLSRTVQVSSGFLSGNSYRLHFGLGKNIKINDVWIIWPDGTKNKFFEFEKNKLIRIFRNV